MAKVKNVIELEDTWIRRYNIIGLSILPRLIHRFNKILVTITTGYCFFFGGIWQVLKYENGSSIVKYHEIEIRACTSLGNYFRQ